MLGQFGKNKSARSANLRPLRHYSSVAKYPYKSFCFVLLLSPYPIDSNLQSKIPQIRSYIIYFAHYIKSFVLDSSRFRAQNDENFLFCAPYRHSERSEESILAIYESHSIRLHCTNLNIIHLIRSWLIYFIHRLKSFVLDTSLHCVPLSMTKFLPYHDKTKRVVILRALARSIHFSDLRILRDSLTLGESMRLNFTQFAHFGLLRPCYARTRNDENGADCYALPKVSLAMTNLRATQRHYEALQTPKQSTTFMMTIRRKFTRFAHDSPTNPKANQKRFMAIQRESTHESGRFIVRDDSKLDFKLKKGVRKWQYGVCLVM